MASLAGYLRELVEKGIFDLSDIVRKYESWVLEDRYMVMAHEREAWVSDAGEMEYITLSVRNVVTMFMFRVWILDSAGLVETFLTFSTISMRTRSRPCSSSP